MANFVSLMVKNYSEGRICITTDRLSGYLTSHSFASQDLWRKTLEWTGQKFNLEKVNIGVINSTNLLPIDYLNNFQPISYGNIDLQYITTNNINTFDLLYFIGLPELVSDDAALTIEEYVRNGGGVLIEVPNIVGNINVIRDIDSVYCSSINRPTYDYSYWTTLGKSHYVYSPDVIVNFYSTILFNMVPSDWSILMTDTPTSSISLNQNINMVGSASSSIAIGYSSVFKNGIVSFD